MAARTDAAITFRLPADLAATLDATVEALAARVAGTPGARVTRNAVGIEALRAGLAELRNAHGLEPRSARTSARESEPRAMPVDPRQTCVPGT